MVGGGFVAVDGVFCDVGGEFGVVVLVKNILLLLKGLVVLVENLLLLKGVVWRF